MYLVVGKRMTGDDKMLKTGGVGSGEKSPGCWCLKTWLSCQVISLLPGPLENRGHTTLLFLSCP